MLAAVDDAAGVLPAIARSMSISQGEANPLEESIIAAIGTRRILLILDNAEQVADHLSMLSTLLAHCPALKVLVTSQIMLRLSAEQVVPIEPLAAISASAREFAPATALFVERTRAVRPDLDVTLETVRTIDDICQQLDGLPLAIELAAGRTRFLSPTALRDRISERLPVLVGGPRDAPERHQTLRATLRWSHDLLDDAERTLFRRLAVFCGSAPYDAIDPICNAYGALGHRTEKVLGALIDHSLVRITDRPANGPRVRLLNTVREFAQEQLLESGEVDELSAAHATWFTHLVIDKPEDHWRTGTLELREWIIRHEPDIENLQAALERITSGEDKAPVVELITGLATVWMELGLIRDAHP
jgi:predicted ATPase